MIYDAGYFFHFFLLTPKSPDLKSEAMRIPVHCFVMHMDVLLIQKKTPARLLQPDEGQPDENTPYPTRSTMSHPIRPPTGYASVFFGIFAFHRR